MSRTHHARKPRENRVAWRNTSAGLRAYSEARAEAQRKANETGRDHGVEIDDVARCCHVFTLPARQSRQGHELRCEVVYPERLEGATGGNPGHTVCLPGHGPLAESRGSLPDFPGMRRGKDS